ncbi:hypothetical protein V1520DRAFT_350965 [Lipomyces starkeyi]
MDEIYTYYMALVLDPCVKGDLIRPDLSEDDDAGCLLLEAIRLELHRKHNLMKWIPLKRSNFYQITQNIATRSFGPVLNSQ